MSPSKNIIVEKTFQFSLLIIDYTEELKNVNQFHLANQLFKSGTSIGANVSEAQNAESKKDFIHKIKIATKEAHEVEYWLMLCKVSNKLTTPNEAVFNLLRDIKLILFKILSTSKKSL